MYINIQSQNDNEKNYSDLEAGIAILKTYDTFPGNKTNPLLIMIENKTECLFTSWIHSKHPLFSKFSDASNSLW